MLDVSAMGVNFYSDVKTEFKIEPYPNLVENSSQNALTRLRISAHSLHIETGRYKRYDKELKAYTNTLRCDMPGFHQPIRIE